MYASAVSLVSLAIINLAAWSLGRPLVRRLGVTEGDRLAVGVWSLVTGFVLGGTVLAMLGVAGLLHAWLVGVVTTAGCLAGLGMLFSQPDPAGVAAAAALGSAADPAFSADAAEVAPPGLLAVRGMRVLAVVVCLGTLASALAPPTAGDALCYHLELPKRFLMEHRLAYDPYDDNCTYPLLAEMWYLWGMAMDSPVCAQLIHWEMGLLLAAGTVLLATPILTRRWAELAGGLVLLIPAVNNQMTAPLNDLALAVLLVFALAAWWRAVPCEDGPPWFLLAGIAAGGALATKYLALLFAAAVVPAWAWHAWQKPPRRRALLAGAAAVACAALAIGGPWYMRAAWYRGNPVYPYFSTSLAAQEPGTPQGLNKTFDPGKNPLGHGLTGLLVSPWQVTMFPERFGDRGQQLGVVLLAALPGVLVVRRLRGLGTLLSVAACYWIAWYFTRQYTRFLLPVVPLLGVAVVWVWIELRRMPLAPRAVLATALTGLLVATALVPAIRCRRQVAVAIGTQDRQQYLATHEPTYAAAAVARATLKPGDQLLSEEFRSFYFPVRLTRESNYRRATQYDRRIPDPAQFSRTLRAQGFSHVLLAEPVDRRAYPLPSPLSRLVEAQAQADPHALLTLSDYRFPDPDGVVRRYRLVALR